MSVYLAMATMPKKHQKIVDRLYTSFRTDLAEAIVRREDGLLFWASTVVEMMAGLVALRSSGTSKKKILLATIIRAVADEVQDPDDRERALLLVSTTVSPAIDMAVAFSKATRRACRGIRLCR